MADPLFPVLTNFYIGAFQTAISEASHLTGLTEEQKLQREIFTQRAYIELGSFDVRAISIPVYHNITPSSHTCPLAPCSS